MSRRIVDILRKRETASGSTTDTSPAAIQVPDGAPHVTVMGDAEAFNIQTGAEHVRASGDANVGRVEITAKGA